MQALKKHFFDHMTMATRSMSDRDAWIMYCDFYDFEEPLASELYETWVARDPQQPHLSLVSDAPH